MIFFGKLNNYCSCDKMWKICAVTQFFILLFIIYPIYPIPKNSNNCNNQQNQIIDLSTPESKLRNGKGTPASKKRIETQQFDPESLELYQSQTNIMLIKDIQANRLRPPSGLPYYYTPDTTTDLSAVKRLHSLVLELLSGKKNGFFIECGAFNGVWLANTLHLEKEHNWTGLLVEADPLYYADLVKTERKAWMINACLATKLHPHTIEMTRIKNQPALSRITADAHAGFLQEPEAQNFQANCLPLASILGSIGQTMNIDYFSLDVETAELQVLKTIPWEFVFIKVISLEAELPAFNQIKEFLATKNYRFVQEIRGPWIHDFVFVHNDFQTAT